MNLRAKREERHWNFALWNFLLSACSIQCLSVTVKTSDHRTALVVPLEKLKEFHESVMQTVSHSV
jgi:hypothetical protein